MFEDFPKKLKLNDDQIATIRLLDKKDKKELHEFFKRLPDRDRQFLKENVTDEKVVERWFKDFNLKKVIPLVVEVDGKIVADGTLHIDEHGWARHIGEIRMVVEKDFRKQSIGLHLVKELYFIAMKLKLEKLVGMMMESQRTAVKIFTDLGFKKEATLKNHVKDLKGKTHNLILMTHSVESHWSELENMIIDHYGDFSGDFSGQ
ncbi:MAG: GNAT family N-acetyltransferase [bacterium]|nr:GNAT family N-acetyltransferase [bacterium]